MGVLPVDGQLVRFVHGEDHFKVGPCVTHTKDTVRCMSPPDESGMQMSTHVVGVHAPESLLSNF